MDVEQAGSAPSAGPAGLAGVSARQARRYGLLLELQTRLAESTADLRSLLDNVARDVAVLLGDACIIFRLDDDGVWLRPVSSFHPDPEGYRLLREIAESGAAKVDEGLVGE